ncbi:hypothetical protein GCM10010207_35180 [Streptomyces atratus]|nr:hypothetical protein GCM10010207_35180 [Streptomyces atratus]
MEAPSEAMSAAGMVSDIANPSNQLIFFGSAGADAPADAEESEGSGEGGAGVFGWDDMGFPSGWAQTGESLGPGYR